MKNTKIIATVAIAGAIGTFAVLNSNSTPAHQNFLATPIEDAEREFINFIANHRRTYATKEEYNFRLGVFATAYEQIMDHNANHAETLGYTKVINHLADMTVAEFNNMKGGKFDAASQVDAAPIEGGAINGGMDWRNSGAVGVPKDQGQCGSCWAFSTTGAIEGLYKIKAGILPSFSEQQLVDCAKTSYGCEGGWPEKAMQYAVGTPVEQENDYRYEARDANCRYQAGKGAVQLHGNGYNAVPANDINQMAAYCNQQPVSILIEADQSVFQHYGGGIINDPACGTNLDHAVLLVGYGDGYWSVKNSWGANWGESGFVRISNNQAWSRSGVCGVLASGKVPTW